MLWSNITRNLSKSKKIFFRKAIIERWCVHLIKRLKKRTSIALKKLQTKIYIYVDVRRDRKSRSYMQDILRHARAANFSSVFHQCTIAWSNFELNFRAQIFESSKNIILFAFLSQLNAIKSVWMNMTTRHREQNNNSDQDLNNNVDRSNRFSKQNRTKNADFSQQFYVNSSNQAYMWSLSSYNFYQYRNSTYQAQSNYQSRQSIESYQQKSCDSFSTVLSTARQSFLLKFSSEFVSISNRKSNKSNVRKFDKSDKTKVYNVDENNETEKAEKDYFDEKNADDYHVSENISYYQSIFYNDFEDENDNAVYLITSKVLLSKLNKITICKKCSNDFFFNNKLHEHLRFDCSDKASLIYSTNVANQSFSIIMITQSSKSTVITWNSIRKLSSINSDAITSLFSTTFDELASSSITSSEFTIILSNTSKSFSINISISLREFKFTFVSIIVSNVDFSKNVDIEQNFQNWSYARIQVTLSSTAEIESICLNTDAEIALCDRQFFMKQTSDVSIRIMIILISVRELNVDKHMTTEYVILFMYFSDQKNDNLVRAKIIREIHLIDNLKTNMLLKNDVIDSEKIDVNISNKSAYIDSCEIIVNLEVRTFRISIQTSVHARKITIVSSHSELMLLVHYTTMSFDRDYLFESNELNFSLYVHLINFTFKHIVVRNESNQAVHISRNCRVDHMIEIDFVNAFQIHVDEVEKIADLTLRRSARQHKISWFKKIIVVVYVVIDVLTSETTITATVISSSKVFHSSILFQREALFQLDVQLSSACYSDYQSLVFASNTSEISDLIDVKSDAEIILDNDVIIHQFNKKVVQIFTKLISKYFDLWKDIDFAKFSFKNWMRISLKSNWKQRIFDKTKIYSLNKKNKELVDEIFDKLHESNRLNWIDEFTSFSYSVFCVWKKVNEKKKDRSIVNIRNLNAITQSNVYSLSLQFDIISVVLDCQYITVLNCFVFFYQWRVHSDDSHKLTVITHREQKSFNVTVMNYKNSSTYVQRQINRFLRSYRLFVKTYVNDIVIHSSILQEHFAHLKLIFDMLNINNIFIKSKKTFIDYLTVHLLNQKIDFLELIIVEKKLKTISRLFFSITFQLFETYLEFTSWLRNYVSWYAEITKSLQILKTELLHDESIVDNVKKIYSRNIKIKNSTVEKLTFFQILQSLLVKLFYLIHLNLTRKLFVNLDSNKKFELVDMIYHVKNIVNWDDKNYSSRKFIESILFFSRLLIDVETKYWSIELKLAEIIWMLKKIKHLVDSIEQTFTVIFTNHEATLNLTKQINLIIVFIDKLNLRLIKASDYIQRFEIKLRHKSNKQHIVSNAFSRLININIDTTFEKNELNAFFIVALVKMKKDFHQKLVVDYNIDLNWKKISSMLDQQNKNDVNVVKLSFYRENELIFRFDDYITDNHVYESHRFCIFQSTIQNILVVAYDDNHSNFARYYDKIAISYYIRDLFKYLRDFFKHCFKCQTYQTRRHKSYDSLQFIFISNISFHTITIDFILILLKSRIDQFDCVMSINCKYFKRIVLVSNKSTWTAAQWNHVLLNRLNMTDWKLSKVIISNRDRKFLSNMWTVMFTRLEIKFLYSAAYHSQTDDLSKRINQIVEIVLRFLISTLKYSDFWFEVLSHVQRDFNNSVSTDSFSNEIVYDFTSVQAIDLTKSIDVSIFELTLKKRRLITRQNASDVIIFDQMNVKFHYDRKHESMFMKQEDVALIKLHKNYNISSAINKKYDQQFVEFFTIIEKIDRLIYRLNISSNWFIHSIFSVT